MRRNIQISGSAGLPILLDLFFPGSQGLRPLVIFSHGFKGFKDWGHFDLVAKSFCAHGLVFLKFNFSHNGTTTNDPLNFGDLEAFGRNNYIIELNDLGRVIDWIVSNASEYRIDAEKIYLLGHSRGGGISILKANEDRRVKKLATWASVCDLLNRNRPSTIKKWKNEGVIYAANARTGQQMPLYYQFHQTILDHKKRLDVETAARQLKVPFLIVHGDADEAVPINEAGHLHKLAQRSVLLRIPGGNHTFGASHPWHSHELPADANNVVRQTIGFFSEEPAS